MNRTLMLSVLALVPAVPATVAAAADAAAGAGPAVQAGAPASQEPQAPVDPKAASYSLGLYFGGQLHGSGIAADVSLDDLERGLREGLAGKEASESDRQRMVQWMRAGRDALAARNRALAAQFMAENAKVPGVKSTPSGLQYTIVAAGDTHASSPKATDRVTVRYRGHLLDGSMFDDSESHGRPATFSLNGGVIAGWKEALQLMKPGAEWRVVVPPDLAYGNAGRPNIPPGSALVFDIQLVRIEPLQSISPGQSPGASKPR